jgi:catechol 2,3-dioxygenase-like lactoylglutathione lyase family enzyme
MHGISHLTILVDDQDEAHTFYTETLGFETRSDDGMEMDGERSRWLVVAPPGSDVALTLVAADTDAKRDVVGRQAGDHVLAVLTTDDCRGEFERLSARGVEFHGEPQEQPWGVEVTFEDLYGNVFDLLEPAGMG